MTMSVELRLRRESVLSQSWGGLGNCQASEGEKGRTDIGEGIEGLRSFVAALLGTASQSDVVEWFEDDSSEYVLQLSQLVRSGLRIVGKGSELVVVARAGAVMDPLKSLGHTCSIWG